MTNIRQYMVWAEKRIARVVIRAKLNVGLLKVIQGPLTITYRVRLIDPTKEEVTKLLSLGEAIAESIQVDGVRVVRTAGAFSIEIPSPLRRTPTSAELVKLSRGISVCVGLDALRQSVYIDPSEHGCVLWIGPSRHGKTSSMKCALYCMAKQLGSRLKFVILCHQRKQEDWEAFAHSVSCMGIVTSPAEHEQVLEWICDVAMKGKTPFKYIVMVDDLLNLLEESPEMASYLSRISSLGAGLGIHLMAGTQEAGSKRGTGGEGVESNATAKILYKATSKARAARYAGDGDVDLAGLTDAKGDAILLTNGHQVRIATGKADNRDIMGLPGGVQYERPWRPVSEGDRAGTEGKDHTNGGGTIGDRTGTHTTSVPVATSGTTLVPACSLPPPPTPNGATLPARGGGDDMGGTTGTGGTVGTKEVQRKLEDREPSGDERAYLRELYRECGSKNQVLLTAWGGVVNKMGKTPKTLKWLNEALTEDDTEEGEGEEAPSAEVLELAESILSPTPAVNGKTVIDMKSEVGRAAVDLLINSGLLPKDDITTRVSY